MDNDFDDDFDYSDMMQDCAWNIIEISEKLKRSPEPLHQEFAQHLMKVAAALRDIYKTWEGDHAEGGDVEAINAVLRLDHEQGSAEQATLDDTSETNK
jgi:hypothetical protein